MFLDIVIILILCFACITTITLWVINDQCKKCENGVSKKNKNQSATIIGIIMCLMALILGATLTYQLFAKNQKLTWTERMSTYRNLQPRRILRQVPRVDQV